MVQFFRSRLFPNTSREHDPRRHTAHTVEHIENYVKIYVFCVSNWFKKPGPICEQRPGRTTF